MTGPSKTSATCTDPECGCNDPVFTTPVEALTFLSGRMKFAGLAEGVAISYARDIDAILAKLPGRFFCNGPAGSFYADTQDEAEKLIALLPHSDDWTVTDLLEGYDADQ